MTAIRPRHVPFERIPAIASEGLDLLRRRWFSTLMLSAISIIGYYIFSIVLAPLDIPTAAAAPSYVAIQTILAIFVAGIAGLAAKIGMEDDGFDVRTRDVILNASRASIIYSTTLFGIALAIILIVLLIFGSGIKSLASEPEVCIYFGGCAADYLPENLFDGSYVAGIMIAAYVWVLYGRSVSWRFFLEALRKNWLLPMLGSCVSMTIYPVVKFIAGALGGEESPFSLLVLGLAPVWYVALYPLVREICGGDMGNKKKSADFVDAHVETKAATAA
jgi:hypothetical protein